MPATQTRGPSILLKGLTVLDTLRAAAPQGMGATEVAAHTGIDRIAVQRIFLALETRGWVRRNEAGKRFFIGEAAERAPARPWTPPGLSESLLQQAVEGMRRLAREVGDAFFLVGIDGVHSVCIHREIGDYPMQILASYPGKRHPLGVGSSGMALLAALPEAQACAIVQANSATYEQYGGISTEMIHRLRLNTRQRGYAVMPNYAVRGALGVGCALTRPDGQAMLAMSVSAITDRMPIKRQAETASLLRRELDKLQGRL